MKFHTNGRQENAFRPESPTRLFRMYSDLCRQWKTDRGLPASPTLNVVLAYQDFETGVRGFRICRDLFEAVGQEFGFGFRNAWTFDYLRNSVLRETAINETMCADMVVISVHAPDVPPPAVRWWLERALEKREGDPGALVLLVDKVSEPRDIILPVEGYLADCAQNGSMELFIKRAAARHSEHLPAAIHGGTPGIAKAGNGSKRSGVGASTAAGFFRGGLKRSAGILKRCKTRY